MLNTVFNFLSSNEFSVLLPPPIFCRIIDSWNLGDMLCGAKKIFPEWADQPEHDLRKIPPGDSPVIIGGGGLLHPGIDTLIRKLSRSRTVIACGIGLNYHVAKPLLSFFPRGVSLSLHFTRNPHRGIPGDWESFLADCPLVGLRDKSKVLGHERFRYCPCPTLGLLDWKSLRHSTAERSRKLLVIEHYDFPIPGFPGADRLTNRFSGDSLELVAEKISQYHFVVTNTYHGALWAIHAGCKVAVFSPFSSRFRSGFPCRVPIIVSDLDLWQAETIWKDSVYQQEVETALDEAQDYLATFREEIRKFI